MKRAVIKGAEVVYDWAARHGAAWFWLEWGAACVLARMERGKRYRYG